jgi:hypothetical protein
VTFAINFAKEGSRTDWLGFTGSVIGALVALIAAGVAWFAVQGQIGAQRLEAEQKRIDDVVNVRAAVRTEVTTYSKYVIGTLEICEQIATKGLSIPMAEATYIGKNLIDPVIYNAVADRVALLTRPQATVEFYMRIAEAKSNLLVMQARASGLTQAQSAMTKVQPSNAEVVADSLITALQLAHAIISEEVPNATVFDKTVQKVALAEIAKSVASAQSAFPNAESFKTP